MTPPVEPREQRETKLRQAFWKHVHSFPDGDRIQNCLQCGTCTGACPVSYAMDLTPRKIVALFRAGRMEKILRSRAIWLCASCYACTVRCPVDIRVTDTLYALKRLAMEKGIYPKGFPVNVLARRFMENVYRYGRNYETGLGLQYYLRADPAKLVGSAGFGLRMLTHGRLGVLPKRIRNVRQVRAIINRAEETGGS
jgi:heterodisulfide reductase subunit C